MREQIQRSRGPGLCPGLFVFKHGFITVQRILAPAPEDTCHSLVLPPTLVQLKFGSFAACVDTDPTIGSVAVRLGAIQPVTRIRGAPNGSLGDLVRTKR